VPFDTVRGLADSARPYLRILCLLDIECLSIQLEVWPIRPGRTCGCIMPYIYCGRAATRACDSFAVRHIMPMMITKLNLVPCRWTEYRRFVNLCCVPTMPFHGGKCWLIEGDIGFIGYNYAYRNNSVRYRLFADHIVHGKCIDVQWLNDNVRQLNRVMVRPEHRGQGIATQLVRQTLPMVGVRYIECLTFAHLIRGILLRTGFVDQGLVRSGTCRYYLWG
jgi:GNAT superfamily N-acetyltransferase